MKEGNRAKSEEQERENMKMKVNKFERQIESKILFLLLLLKTDHKKTHML